MTTVANFHVIRGDVSVLIGDSDPVHSEVFDIPDYNGGDAVLTFMVKGLTAAADSVIVKINGATVGEILPDRYAAISDQIEEAQHHNTQWVNVGQGVLSAASPNTLRVEAVSFPESTPTNTKDDFSLQDIILMYHVTV
ncbi:hypothetical protein [Geodermatophilus sp. URMC 65]